MNRLTFAGAQCGLAWLATLGWAANAAATAPAPDAPEQQSTQAAKTGAASKQAPTQLETVKVTATKQEKSVEEIPASITAIEGSELEQRGAQNLNDLVKLVPGVNLTAPAGNAARITIRGIAGEANTNPTTGILFGDVSFSDAYGSHVTLDPNPFDLQDVEVLKGPQGTLFGAAALNGAIRYVPMQPEFGVVSGKYYMQYSSVHEGGTGFGTGAALNFPLDSNNKAAMRIVAYDQQLPGYIDNTLTHDKDSNRGRQKGLRAIVALQPTDKLSINLTYAGQRTRFNDLGDTDNEQGKLVVRNAPGPVVTKPRYDLTSLAVNYDFGAFRLTSESAYVWKDYLSYGAGRQNTLPNLTVPLLGTYDHSRSNSWSQEFRLTSNDSADSPWSWVTGVFASHQSINENSSFTLGNGLPPLTTAGLLNRVLFPIGNIWLGLGQPNYNDQVLDVRVKELAAFFDVTRKLGDGWELSLGGRLYRTESGGTADNSGLLMGTLNLFTGQPGMRKVIDDTARENGFNPKASLTWHANDHVLLYTLADKGYRVGGVQWGISGLSASQAAPSTFKTDSIWNYELGARTNWLDRTLSFDATLFYERWKNPQVLILDGTGLGSYIDNVGGVVSKGAEVSLKYLVPQIKGLSFNVSGAYTHARTTDSFESASNQVVPSGTEWPLSPRWQTAETVNYDHPLGNWSLGGFISHAYISKAKYGITQPDTVFGYSQWDAQVRLGNFSLPTQPELSLTVNNVFDHRGKTTAFSGTYFQSATYIQPRTIMLRLSGSF